MKTPIEDFGELRIGMPLIYIEIDGETKTECAARVEGVGFDWAVLRYSTESDGEYLALVIDVDTIFYEIPDIEIAKAKVTVALGLADRISGLKNSLHVKGIGDL